jgi:hypothetical protein
MFGSVVNARGPFFLRRCPKWFGGLFVVRNLLERSLQIFFRLVDPRFPSSPLDDFGSRFIQQGRHRPVLWGGRSPGIFWRIVVIAIPDKC